MMRALLLAAAAAIAPRPIPSLPVLARVHIDVAPAHLIVTQDVRISRGEWSSGDLDLYVAFGAPGVPRAIDAHVLALAENAFFAPKEAAQGGVQGEPITIERQTRRPARAQLLLGRENMAGIVVHLKEPALRRAFAASGTLMLRLRSLIPTEGTARDVVVRLGTDGAAPIAISSIEVAADPKLVSRADAKLCGPNADPYPLAVTMSRAVPITYPRPALPSSIARHGGDDLCVRFVSP